MSCFVTTQSGRPVLGDNVRRVARAYPTLLRVGLSEVVAYRAEFVVWILTTNMPFVMLAIWHAPWASHCTWRCSLSPTV